MDEDRGWVGAGDADEEGYKCMPRGRPPVTREYIEFIEGRIDDGCPEQ